MKKVRRRWNSKLFVNASMVLCLVAISSCSDSGLRPGDGRLEVEGGSIFYRVIGSGPGIPVILLHGGPGYSSHYLEPLGEALGNERPMIAYDQLGSGRSDRVTDEALFRIDRYVRELDSLRSALDLDQVHLYGHSWGSMLALEYLATNPSGVVSVTLASPIIVMDTWAADTMSLVETLSNSSREAILRHEAAGTTSSQEYQDANSEYWTKYVLGMEPPYPPEVNSAIEAYSPIVYETMWGPSEFSPTGNLRDFDRSDVLSGLDIPILFTAGRFDEARPETIERFASTAQDAEVRIFENSAHVAMVTEREAYAEAIRDFLNEAER